MLCLIELPACGPVNIEHCSMSQSVPRMLHPPELPTHGAVNFVRSSMPQSVPVMLCPQQLPAHGEVNFFPVWHAPVSSRDGSVILPLNCLSFFKWSQQAFWFTKWTLMALLLCSVACSPSLVSVTFSQKMFPRTKLQSQATLSQVVRTFQCFPICC